MINKAKSIFDFDMEKLKKISDEQRKILSENSDLSPKEALKIVKDNLTDDNIE